MPALTIHQRLNYLPERFNDPIFLGNRGIGKSLGFYIFDYEPEEEPQVQEYIAVLKARLADSTPTVQVAEVSLYQVILGILEERGFLQKAFALESQRGSAELAKSVKPIVRPEEMVRYIQRQLSGSENLILITGVGASWPILRSHTILNNLQGVLDQIPVVMFFPGSYDGHELRLFNTLKDDNYYQALSLIPR